MKDLINNAMNISKMIIKETITKGDIVVDATLGNGNDAFFLAELVGEEGCIYAFDVQSKALESSRSLIPEHLQSRIHMKNCSHEKMHEHISTPVKLILFNLGYLPGVQRGVCTHSDSTIAGIKSGLSILGEYGIILLVVYRGHEEGKQEWKSLVEYIATLPQNIYNVSTTDFPNQKNNPPALISIQKR